jgi:hypothetical protein
MGNDSRGEQQACMHTHYLTLGSVQGSISAAAPYPLLLLAVQVSLAPTSNGSTTLYFVHCAQRAINRHVRQLPQPGKCTVREEQSKLPRLTRR